MAARATAPRARSSRARSRRPSRDLVGPCVKHDSGARGRPPRPARPPLARRDRATIDERVRTSRPRARARRACTVNDSPPSTAARRPPGAASRPAAAGPMAAGPMATEPKSRARPGASRTSTRAPPRRADRRRSCGRRSSAVAAARAGARTGSSPPSTSSQLAWYSTRSSSKLVVAEQGRVGSQRLHQLRALASRTRRIRKGGRSEARSRPSDSNIPASRSALRPPDEGGARHAVQVQVAVAGQVLHARRGVGDRDALAAAFADEAGHRDLAPPGIARELP